MFPFGERFINLTKGIKAIQIIYLGFVPILLGMLLLTSLHLMGQLLIIIAALLMIIGALYILYIKEERATFLMAEEKVTDDFSTKEIKVREEAIDTLETWHYRLALQKLLITISINFINLARHEIDHEINRALRAIGVFTEVDHSYLSLYDAKQKSWHKSYEWFAKEIQNDIPQNDLIEDLPWITEKLEQFQSIYIPNVAAMPTRAKQARERFESQGIQSLLFIPITLGNSLIGVLSFKWRQKATHWANEDIKLFELAGQILLNALNITESEQFLFTQGVTKYAAELEAANKELTCTSRMKDEFLAAMSHELRTPLNAILGISEGLLEEAYGQLHNTQLGAIVRVEENARHLLRLINGILELSKIEAGEIELELNPVIVKTICQASLHVIKESAYRKQIHVLSKFEPNMTTIEADEQHLKQILVNLLSNAVKFTPQGGTIGLFVTLDTKKNIIQFCIWDTGIGIAKEKIKYLFKPFVQLDSSLSRHYGGVGLGLSLAQRIVSLHGGQITVQSEVGKGSHFIVSLPVKKKKLN